MFPSSLASLSTALSAKAASAMRSVAAPIEGAKRPSLSWPAVWRPDDAAVVATIDPTTTTTTTTASGEEASALPHPAWAVASLLSIVLRCIGWIGLAATVAAVPLLLFGAVAPPPPSLDVVAGGGGSHLLLLGAIERVYAVCAGAWRSAGLAQRALAAWLVAEGCFFAACNLIARRMSAFDAATRRPEGALTREWRAEVWRRILADPTQSPKAFARSWFKFSARHPTKGAAHGSAVRRVRWRRRRLIGGRAPAEPRRVEATTSPSAT